MSAELMKSKFVRRPSLRSLQRHTTCPSTLQLSLNLLHRFLSNFGCCLPWTIRRGILYYYFFFFLFANIFSFSISWDPMSAKISKRYSCYKSQQKVFKLVLNFLPNSPHKNTFGIFEICWKLKFSQILIVFVNMGPHGRENFKTLLLLQITAKSFKLLWIFPPLVLTKLRLEILKFECFWF